MCNHIRRYLLGGPLRWFTSVHLRYFPSVSLAWGGAPRWCALDHLFLVVARPVALGAVE